MPHVLQFYKFLS